MKLNIAAALLFFTSGTLAANDADDRRAVVQLLDDFFEAMAAGEFERMRTMMTPDGILYGYREAEDGLQVFRRTHTEFIDSLASAETRMVERIWNPEWGWRSGAAQTLRRSEWGSLSNAPTTSRPWVTPQRPEPTMASTTTPADRRAHGAGWTRK